MMLPKTSFTDPGRETMKTLRVCFVSVAMAACALVPALAQTVPVATTASGVPTLVRYSGTTKDLSGKPLTGSVGVTFALYRDETGGSPLWLESQNVRGDTSGHYNVSLGAQNPLPVDVFSSGEARWLGIQIAGQPEQPRVLLVSVPYALKAADAETIGGLPPSAFVLAGTVNNAPSVSNSSNITGPSSPSALPAASNVTTSGGSINTLPLWTTATNVQSSALTQTGTGATARIGIGTATPASTLDVKGGATVRGTLLLPSIGASTATAGTKSQPLNLQSSAFNSSTAAAVTQTFQWAAEPVGNNTATPSGTLNLLFGSGTIKPTETGLKINSKGLLTFAAGQAFPGAGTITGVTAGTNLTGGGTTGNVTLNLNTTALQTANDARYAQLGAANIFTQPLTLSSSKQVELQATSSASSASVIYGHSTDTSSFTSEGVVGVADGPTGLGVFGASNGSAGIGVEGKGAMNGMLGFSGVTSTIWDTYAAVGVHGDTGITNGVGVLGTVDGGYGVKGISNGTVLNTAGTYGVAGPPSGFGGIAGVWGDAANHVGTFGSSVNYSGVVGESSLSNGVWGVNNSQGYGVYGVGAWTAHDNGAGVRGESFGTTWSLGQNSNDGVQGFAHSRTGFGVAGTNDAPGGIGVYGYAPSGGFGFDTPNDVQQARYAGGWAKAMVFVDPFTANGTAITRCFNSQASGTTVSTPPCGFSISHAGQGQDFIDFGFQVNDRFISSTIFSSNVIGTCVLDANNYCATPGFSPIQPTANQILVITKDTSNNLVDSAFWIIVF
jgi:hypothetical protein